MDSMQAYCRPSKTSTAIQIGKKKLLSQKSRILSRNGKRRPRLMPRSFIRCLRLAAKGIISELRSALQQVIACGRRRDL